MFNSLLNAPGKISVDSLILNVVIILGVVVAASLIVYFLWESVASLTKKEKKKDEELRFDDVKQNAVDNNVMVSDFKLDDEPVKTQTAENEETDENVVLIDQTKIEDVNPEKAEEEKQEIEKENADEDDENAKRRAYLEARRQELIKRMQAEMDDNSADAETEEEKPVEDEVKAEEVAETEEQPETVENEGNHEVETENVEVQESVDTVEEEPVVLTNGEEVEETPVVEENNDEALEEERKSLIAEKEKYEAMVRELEAAKKALAEQAEQKEEPTVVEKIVEVPVQTNAAALTLDELKERLANAEERLKATEKEFKQCKKEYIPLRRVWDAHDKDEKKLRRKEALVAKQKVLLYGVNNYAEIDQEKATKLAEDLDLLDGLKLSVQHCEEVMKKNEERYPLLEKMYNVLKVRNDELKKDIAAYREEIERLESEQANSESSEQE